MLFMILGLGFSSCQKDESKTDEIENGETFVLNGEVFNVEDIKSKFALISGFDRDELIWVPDSLGFKRPISRDYIYKMEPFIEVLKEMGPWEK